MISKWKWICLSILSLFLFSLASFSQDISFWKDQPKKKTLSNGLVAVVQKDESSGITVMQVLIKGGKSVEPEGKYGLSYLTTRLALEIPDKRKLMDLMKQATRISIAGHGEYTMMTIACLTENLSDTLEIVSKIMLKPLFSGLRIDGIKKVMNQLREIEDDEPINVAFKTMKNIFFKNTSYAGSIYGSEDSVKAIKKDDIEDFFETYFTTGNMFIAVSTDLDPENIFPLLEKYFKNFPARPPLERKGPTFSPPEKERQSIEKDTLQAVVSIAYPLPSISPKNFLLSYLLENLIGKGLNSRLWFLRSEKKLAYNVNARATLYRPGGMIEAYLETDQVKTNTALKELKRVMADLYQNGTTEEELEVTKTHYKASLLRNNEVKTERTQTMAEMEALNLGYEFLNQIFQEIDAVTLDEMNAFLQSVLYPEGSVELVIGRKD